MKTSKKRILNLLFLVFFSICLSECNNSPQGQIVFLENGKIELGFDKNTGSLLVFRDILNSHNYLDTTIPAGPLWEIDLFNDSEIVTIDMTASSKFHFSKRNNSLILTWGKFSGTKNKDFNVQAVITLDKDKALSSWKISVNNTEGEKINRVVFPKITEIKELGDEYLAVPFGLGLLYKDPRTQLSKIKESTKKFEWNYPELSMQCFALYNQNKCGFYASCNDSLAFRKSFSFELGKKNNITYQMNNYPALDSTLNSYSPSYEAIIGSFKGDWITAAEQYREWGTKQRWCLESRLKNGTTPKWLEETALWVWNRGKSDNVLTPAKDLRKKINLPISVFWHWWHGCSYDDGFPEYLPPREGKESFIKAISSAQNEGIRAIVYMNYFQWGSSTQSWIKENASLYAVKDINGNLKSHAYNIFTNKPLTNMCVATQFWKDKYSSLCDSVVNTYNTNGVYMDQTYLTRMCYDKNHGHPIGGGNYWTKNFGELTKQIRSKISVKNQPILAGEFCGEAQLPYLNAFLTLQVSRERFAGVEELEVIPFFPAVYHEYAITYGTYSSLLIPPYDKLWPEKFAPEKPLRMLDTEFNNQFLMEQARSFVWGMQPTIANYQSFLETERKEEIDYLINLAKVRYKGLKYLLHGKFMRSPEMIVPKEDIKISTLAIYNEFYVAGKTIFPGKTKDDFQEGSFPLIYSGTWRASDKNIGIALASISKKPFNVNFTINPKNYELPPSGEIYIIDIEGRKKLADYSDEKIEVNYTLPGKGLCIIEIKPDN
jgi:Domain of unknown function (DUF6259)